MNLALNNVHFPATYHNNHTNKNAAVLIGKQNLRALESMEPSGCSLKSSAQRFSRESNFPGTLLEFSRSLDNFDVQSPCGK